MNTLRDAWTSVHDLALVYIALAYGTDCELTEDELEALTKRLSRWGENADVDVDQVVIDAMATYLDEDTEAEVAQSITALAEELDSDQRRQALQDVVRIAEADGVLLSTEQSLISTLADVWSVKSTEQRLLDRTQVEVEEVPTWSLLHDLALIYLVLAHSTDEKLSSAEIGMMIDRLGEWQPDLSEEEIRQVLRESLDFYSQEPDETVLGESVKAVRDTLSVIQRLVVLDDLNQIAHADGRVLETEREMISGLAAAWGVSVRMNDEA